MIAKPEPIEPSEFDLVVLGTGLVESLVAAAAAKAGKSVLQLDVAETYGGDWTSLSLQDLLTTLAAAGGTHEPTASTGPFSGSLMASISGSAVLECPGLGDSSLGPSSQYNIDLSPKVLYGAGPFIDLLLGSGAHNYTEFKLVQGSYLLEGRLLKPVPATRSEVFKDRSLSLAQKRALMKFLKGCSEALAGQGPLQGCFDERPFATLMREQGLDSQLQALLLHAVLMQDQAQRDTAAPASGVEAPQGTLPPEGGSGEQPSVAIFSAAAALRLMGIHLGSVGRYGQDAGPFLTPMYGCGELPQAFCRVAAVAGAIQVLRCPVDGPIFDEHTFSCIGVELGTGQVIRCQHLAASQDYLQEWLSTFHPDVEQSAVHRCTAILDSPLVPGEQQSLLVVPPGALPGAVHAVRGLVLSSSTKASPADRYLLHLWTPAAAPADSQAAVPSAVEVLQSALDLLGLDTSGLQPQQAQQQEALAKLDAATLASGAINLPLEQQQQEQQQQQEKGGPPAGAAGSSGNASAAGLATQAGTADNTSGAAEAHSAAESPAADHQLRGDRQPGRPRVLLAAFYMQHQTAIRRYTDAWPHNMVLCPGPDHTATFLSAVEDAKACFAGLYPEVRPFPLEQPPETALAGDDSDEEAVEALEAVLGRLPAASGGGGGGSNQEERQQPMDGIPGEQVGVVPPESRQL